MSSEIKWIKITTDMFEDEKIDFISSLPESDAIIVIWIRILALAGKCNAGGYVLLTEKIPYTEEMLAHKFKKPLNIVRLAMETFRKLEMIEFDGNVIYLPNWEKHQNVEAMEKVREYERIRKAKQREAKKLEQLPPPKEDVRDIVPPNVPDSPGDVTVLDIDKDLNNIFSPIPDDKIIFDFWNTMGIMKHRELNRATSSAINARLKSYTVDELKEAITNYRNIIKSDLYFFSYKWSLYEFMHPDNVVKFLTENEPFKNYIKTPSKRTERQVAQPDPVQNLTPEEREFLDRAYRGQAERNGAV